MLKGCQRKIILLRNTGSSIFEEAYFVLKADADTSQTLSEADMVNEARRIVEANTLHADARHSQLLPKLKTKQGNSGIGWFFAGCAFSTVVAGLFLLIF